MPRALLLLAALLMLPTAHAQTGARSLGPQLSTLGVGLSGSYRLSRLLSVSAEANLLPTLSASYDVDGIDYDADAQVRGSLLLVNLHPFGGTFSVGGGLFFGGYELDATATPAEPVEIGGDTYQPEEIGTLDGVFSARGPIPVVMLGWRGRGFNFGVGVTTGYAAKVELTASGPYASRPEVQESLEEERQDIEDQIREVPVLPYLRLGWQFGF